jgi:hypothetical protein
MFKLLLSFLIGIIPVALAQPKPLQTDVEITYTLQESVLSADLDITIQNLTTESYAKAFTLTLVGSSPEKVIASTNGRDLPVTLDNRGNTSTITVNFDKPAVGIGKQMNFQIYFTDSKLLTQTGEVWELILPKLANTQNFDSLEINLAASKNLGELAYMSPDPIKTSDDENFYYYSFDPKHYEATGITAAFGQFQVFHFDLTYHLENETNKDAISQAAIPPDTSLQRVIYDKIIPPPESVQIDQDGNWIANFKLKPKERLDVKAAGWVQIFASPRSLVLPTEKELLSNLKPTAAWQSDDPIIQKLASELQTPQAIYDYVVTTLSYDYARANPGSERRGAVGALSNPASSICTEFTDLFIAIARAAGIPAREVNGYVYTDNPNLNPLSLVADVLHSWPQYWDKEEKVWKSIDPTWGHTTGGLDYFSKLDLRHFAFVHHGENYDKPYPPGSYKIGQDPQKDVDITFSTLPPQHAVVPQLTLDGKNLIIKNPGPAAIYNQTAQTFFDDQKADAYTVTSLPPFTTQKIALKLPIGILGNDMPDQIKVDFMGETITGNTHKSAIIVTTATAILVFILAISIVSFTILKSKSKHK